MSSSRSCGALVRRFSVAALVLSVACGVAALQRIASGQETTDDEEAARLVNEALEREAQGDSAGRQKLLDEAIRRFPEFAPARWQSGQIKEDGAWRDIEAVRRAAAERPTLLEYYKRREEAGSTVAAQLRLARWCERNGLDAQRRAHLSTILTVDPGHAVARRELGYIQVAREWILKDSYAERQKNLEARRESFEHWQPIVAELNAGLKSSNAEKRAVALQRLQGIADPAAADALEWAFSGEKIEIAAPVLEVLSRLEGQPAATSLGHFAAFSASNDVRLAAIAHLEKRNLNQSVPPLLDLLSTQIEARIEHATTAEGEFYVRHLFYREGSNSQYFFVSDFNYIPNSKLKMGALARPSNIAFGRLWHYLAHVKMDREIGAEQVAVGQANDSIVEINAAVIWVLERLLKAELGDDPYTWWQYWYTYGGAAPADGKKVVAHFKRKSESVAHPSCEAVHGVWIHTERGEIPIEDLRVGDRALAQNPDTGEVALQPVLFVSNTADAREVVTLRVAGNSIDATPAQRYWVVGRGWIAAAELKAGDLIHGLHGAARVESVEEGKRAKTTHVVIDGWQNVFLGRSALLGGDHAGRPPNGRPLPGMKPLP